MLFETYQELARRFPNACQHLFGSKIDSAQGLWLSVDAQGQPYLLFEMAEDDGQPDLKLKAVEVRFACPCDIQFQDEGALSGTYTLVSLANDDPDIIRVFLRLLEEAFLAPGADQSPAAVRSQILSIADLFTRLSDDLKDVVGLWGELHIIRTAQNVNAAARAWSSSARARYDFMTEHFALEVKTTLKSARQHRFSLEQLRPNADIQVYVASILLAELPGGEAVYELIDEVYAALDDADSRARFFRQCLRKGGADIYGSELRLSTLPDCASIALFDAGTLPVPSLCGEDPISNVRFDLELGGLGAVTPVTRRQVLSFSNVGRSGSLRRT
ncbi:PD-(D/E)XK motif protein [Paracoccus sp. M683]|uniref:PD-(D/E)XK motif protein n=1 Tax=Paracoccus sp. M683 TaxID=2594268 RepID=UPI00117D7D75|nr:PD-(D/E)XK motif protein [Paracoccus sp. M683]TRW92743.1 PD-(D/E)XK motif protein [Paracoccus sp. M683]